MSLSQKIQNFYERWNIVLDEPELFRDFKNRTINSVTSVFLPEYPGRGPGFEENEFLKTIGKPIIEQGTLVFDLDVKFSETRAYQILCKEKDFVRYLFYLQALFWLDSLDEQGKQMLYARLQQDIACSRVQVNLKKTRDGYIFYPAGAKLLDQGLVNDVLDWLNDYRAAHDSFTAALNKYSERAYRRNIVDDLRLALEALLRDILHNERSLENQQREVGAYLKAKNVPREISNMFWQLVDYYSKYQNRYAKHDDQVGEYELEFVLYLTGTFMRFLLMVENG